MQRTARCWSAGAGWVDRIWSFRATWFVCGAFLLAATLFATKTMRDERANSPDALDCKPSLTWVSRCARRRKSSQKDARELEDPLRRSCPQMGGSRLDPVPTRDAFQPLLGTVRDRDRRRDWPHDLMDPDDLAMLAAASFVRRRGADKLGANGIALTLTLAGLGMH